MENLPGLLGTLVMLIFLQVVLGFDNLLYISIESKRVEKSQQARVRLIGILIAIALRIVLLFAIMAAIGALEKPMFEIAWEGVITASVSGHMLIVLFGGAFILYTAIKEIWHMMSIEEEHDEGEKETRSPKAAIFWIVIMNLVFSFDSILGAIALTKNMWIMGIAVVTSGVMMIVMADRVTEFLKKNRMYEVLGLFILFLVGIMLLSEAGHLGHLTLFGSKVTQMSKGTFYFVLAILVIVDLVQGRYKKKINLELAMAEKTKAGKSAG